MHGYLCREMRKLISCALHQGIKFDLTYDSLRSFEIRLLAVSNPSVSKFLQKCYPKALDSVLASGE